MKFEEFSLRIKFGLLMKLFVSMTLFCHRGLTLAINLMM